ncbi:MAG: YigZ family protein [Firmicutes bacterium]|nr:YigZ family protein [Bacillota bacterium]
MCKQKEGNDGRPVEYLSVAKKCDTELIIKKSRFIAQAFPVQDMEEVTSALRSVQEAYPDASHICYAYRCGLSTEVVRFNDAGEPSGTAGRPILEVIEREELRNTLITVTRYFGGTLLGAAGLVRAYSGSAAAVIAAAGKAVYKLHGEYELNVDYPLWGRVERILVENSIRIAQIEYGTDVLLRILVPTTHVDRLYGLLRDASSGDFSWRLLKESYYPVT